jgi:IclR family transcriptional regulator, acetate operon repressor
MSQPLPGTQTVVRAMTLLKAFSDERPEWGLSDLARSVGLNKATAFRLLAALESEGMLARNPRTDQYRLGPETIALGARALRSNDLRSAARPVLTALAFAVSETATLEILEGGDALILDEVAGPSLIGTAPSIGTRWPVYATSTGKVLISELEESDRSRRLPRRLSRITDRTISDRAALDRELAKVRTRGFATAIEELEQGYVAIAAPVRDHDGRIVAGISVGGPSTRLTSARIATIAPEVRKAAADVSRRLGAH